MPSKQTPTRGRLLGASLVMLLAGLGMLGGGIFEVIVQRTGVATVAQVTDCQELGGRYHNVSCTGSWTTGDLVLGNGHVALGTVDGATENDIGKSVRVRLSGDRAYAESMRIPIILLGIGLAFVIYGVQMLRRLPPRA